MQKQVKNAFILLLAVFALLAALALLTDALPVLQTAHPFLFLAAALLFLASISVWLVSWAMLIRGRTSSIAHISLLGFGCVFAALTPIQVGADALRSIKLKELSVPYSDSIAASMVVKGIKFLLIALAAALSFLLVLQSTALGFWLKAAMLSGFAVVAIAALLFLLPLQERIGLGIASLFASVGKRIPPFTRLSSYFRGYSSYLQQLSLSTIAIVSLLALISLALEFAAFSLSLLSASVALPLCSAIAMFAILSILERTPFLPRGIGAVEAAGFVLLSLPGFTAASLSPAQIAAVLIIFDSVRLIIPTIASLAVYSFLFSKGPK